MGHLLVWLVIVTGQETPARVPDVPCLTWALALCIGELPITAHFPLLPPSTTNWCHLASLASRNHPRVGVFILYSVETTEYSVRSSDARYSYVRGNGAMWTCVNNMEPPCRLARVNKGPVAFWFFMQIT